MAQRLFPISRIPAASLVLLAIVPALETAARDPVPRDAGSASPSCGRPGTARTALSGWA